MSDAKIDARINKTIHVFAGTGPANLDRAVAILATDPDAILVFYDKRLQINNHESLSSDSIKEHISRKYGRANIFRFETDEVTKKLLERGVSESDLNQLTFQREFISKDANGKQKIVFQRGDDQVFSSKAFTQIQIRDLQELLFKTIDRISINKPIYISENLGEYEIEKSSQKPETLKLGKIYLSPNGTYWLKKIDGTIIEKTLPNEFIQRISESNFDALIKDWQFKKDLLSITTQAGYTVKNTDELYPEQVREMLNSSPALGDIENSKIHIHVATGALTGDENKDEILYPDQSDLELEGSEENLTSDVARMMVTPVHGTVTFKINPEFCQTLKSNQVSLDDADWSGPLAEFGWKLVRPPRIRVFYTNDILYIGAEIPESLMAIKDKAEYERQVTAYTRKIGELVFPNLKNTISNLEVNEHLRSRFPTARGQRGKVLDIQRTDAEGKLLPQNITTYYHGDSRYLPHYQTGSGFITAFLENELYVNIYKQKTFNEVLDWLYKQEDTQGIKEKILKEYRQSLGDENELSDEEIFNHHIAKLIYEYSQDLPKDIDPSIREDYALEAFKAEVFKQRSLDIIEKNQEKVGRYLNAINEQTLELLSQKNEDFLNSFNVHNKTNLKVENFKDIDPHHLVIALLETGTTSFLKAELPKLLNMNFENISDQKLQHLRTMLVKNFKYALMINEMKKTITDPHELCRNYEDICQKTEMEPVVLDLNRKIDAIKSSISYLNQTSQSRSSFFAKRKDVETITRKTGRYEPEYQVSGGQTINAGYYSYIAISNLAKNSENHDYKRDCDLLIKQLTQMKASECIEAIQNIRERFNEFGNKAGLSFFESRFLNNLDNALQQETHYKKAKHNASSVQIEKADILLEFREKLANSKDATEYHDLVNTYEKIIKNKRGGLSWFFNLNTDSTRAVKKIAEEFAPETKKPKPS